MKTKSLLTISLAVFALTVAHGQTTSQPLDSLQYIEKILGITFETTSAKGGGVRVIKIEKGKWSDEKVITAIYPMKGIMFSGDRIEIKNTSDLTKTLFELRKTNSSRVFLSTKGKMVGLQRDISEINPNFSSTTTTVTVNNTPPPSTNKTQDSSITITEKKEINQRKDTSTTTENKNVSEYGTRTFFGFSYSPSAMFNHYSIGNAQDFFHNQQTGSGVWSPSDGIADVHGAGGFYELYFGFTGRARNSKTILGFDLGFGKTPSHAIWGKTDVGLSNFQLYPVEIASTLSYIKFGFPVMFPINDKTFFFVKLNAMFGFMKGDIQFAGKQPQNYKGAYNTGGNIETGLNFGKKIAFTIHAGYRLLQIKPTVECPDGKCNYQVDPFKQQGGDVYVNWNGWYINFGIELGKIKSNNSNKQETQTTNPEENQKRKR
ncbi:MAG: hypothetical protein HY063_10915 [Bacteroidetes bacterium]|nr:hypothetical protein [Bacteroidota bacterium]